MTAGLGVVPAGGAPATSAASLTLRPIADAQVSSAAPRRNFGNARVLTVDGRPSVRSYLRFRLGRLGGPVRHASLWLYFASGSGRGVRVTAVRSRSWSEHRVTYANAPGLGRTLAQGRVTSGWVEFDVSEGMRRSGAVDLALSSTAPPGKITLASREVRARAPQLVLSAGGSSADPVIAAAGNIACDPADPDFNGGLGIGARCRQQATSDLLSPRLAAVLALGDNQYECGGYAAYLQAYDRSWGRLKSITHPVPGNHEYRSPTGGTGCDPARNASGYFHYFGAAAGEPGKGYYSFDVGSWHLIALNSFCEAVACGAGSPQERWLKSDLASHRAACTLAFWHHPRFSSSYSQSYEPVAALWRDLVAARADIVLVAHDHIYERFALQDAREKASPSGVREFVVGTGGKEHHPLFTIRPNSQVRNETTFGVLELTLHPRAYDWRFVPVTGGTFSDSGSDACR